MKKVQNSHSVLDKCFWINVLWQTIKTSKVTQIIFSSNFTHGKVLSYVDHSRITYNSAYLNFRTESQTHRKLNHFWEKIVMVYINIIVLDQCCCAKKIIVCLWIFSWIQRDCISGFGNQRFKLWHYHWRATRQTKQSYFKLLCKKMQDNDKLHEAEPRNRSGNISRSTISTISTVKLFLADSALPQQYFGHLWLERSAS